MATLIKEIHFIDGGSLTIQRFSSSSWQGEWQHAGRHSDILTTVTQFLQQDHTYFNKATSPNKSTPYELMGTNDFHTTTERLRFLLL